MSWIKLKSDGSKRLFTILTIVVSDDCNEVALNETHQIELLFDKEKIVKQVISILLGLK